MTNEEAIETLKRNYPSECFEQLREAVDVAIKALKSTDEDLIRRQDALNCFHCWIDKHGDICEPCDMAEYRAIENLPAVMEEIE